MRDLLYLNKVLNSSVYFHIKINYFVTRFVVFFTLKQKCTQRKRGVSNKPQAFQDTFLEKKTNEITHFIFFTLYNGIRRVKDPHLKWIIST
jgi:hypothetical protein